MASTLLRSALVAGALVVGSSAAAAQASLDWARTYDGPPGDQNDQASLVVVDSAGNAYFSGFSLGFSGALVTSDVILLKYDPAGNLLWERRWDGGAQDQADAMILAPNGDILIAARRDSFVSSYGEDILLLRYDQAGNLLWETPYDGPGSLNDRAFGLANGPQGSIYVAGRTGDNFGANDTRGLVARFDAQGNLQWEEHYIGPWLGDDLAVDVAVDAAGRAYVACTSTSQVGQGDLALLCYDASGNQLWERRHAGAGAWWDRAAKVALGPSGAVYLAGTDYPGNANYDDALLLKYDVSGNLLWTFRWDGPGHRDEKVEQLLVDAGGAWLVGTSNDASSRPQGMALRVGAGGALKSATVLTGVGQYGEVFADAAPGPGSVFMVGYALDFNLEGDVLLAQVDESGNVLWQETWDSGDDDLGLAVATAPQGLYVGGDTYNVGTRIDLLAMRWDAVTGLTLEVPILQLGSILEARIVGAQPGATAGFLLSRTGIGAGPCSAALGGACVDLLPPVSIFSTAIANAQGVASIFIFLPPGLPQSTVYLQGAVPGSPGELTAPMVRTIQP